MPRSSIPAWISGKFTQVVKDETQAAQQIGVSSTPSFLINGQPIVGAQDFSAFQKVIEEARGQ